MSLTTITIIGVVVLAALIWFFLRVRSKDLIEEMIAKRKASSIVVCRADFMEGPTRIPVALSLQADKICYENPDLEACLELRHIEEVEYDEETATGHQVDGRVLRLRAHGHLFEFLLDRDVAKKWEAALVPKHFDEGTAKAV